jgi:hypothetical protein
MLPIETPRKFEKKALSIAEALYPWYRFCFCLTTRRVTLYIPVMLSWTPGFLDSSKSSQLHSSVLWAILTGFVLRTHIKTRHYDGGVNPLLVGAAAEKATRGQMKIHVQHIILRRNSSQYMTVCNLVIFLIPISMSTIGPEFTCAQLSLHAGPQLWAPV